MPGLNLVVPTDADAVHQPQGALPEQGFEQLKLPAAVHPVRERKAWEESLRPLLHQRLQADGTHCMLSSCCMFATRACSAALATQLVPGTGSCTDSSRISLQAADVEVHSRHQPCWRFSVRHHGLQCCFGSPAVPQVYEHVDLVLWRGMAFQPGCNVDDLQNLPVF